MNDTTTEFICVPNASSEVLLYNHWLESHMEGIICYSVTASFLLKAISSRNSVIQLRSVVSYEAHSQLIKNKKEKNTK